MLETGEDVILPSRRKKLGILKYLGRNILKSSKLLLANDLILGKINYLLPLYGGTPTKYLDKIQVILNNTVWFITGPTKEPTLQH